MSIEIIETTQFLPSSTRHVYWVLALCQHSCSKWLTRINSLHLYKPPWGGWLDCRFPHFTDEEMEAHRGPVICIRWHQLVSGRAEIQTPAVWASSLIHCNMAKKFPDYFKATFKKITSTSRQIEESTPWKQKQALRRGQQAAQEGPTTHNFAPAL